MGEQATLLTVGMAMITGLSAAWSNYLAYLSNKDKTQKDAEVLTLKAQVQTLTDKVADCHEDRDELRGRVQKLEDKA